MSALLCIVAYRQESALTPHRAISYDIVHPFLAKQAVDRNCNESRVMNDSSRRHMFSPSIFIM